MNLFNMGYHQWERNSSNIEKKQKISKFFITRSMFTFVFDMHFILVFGHCCVIYWIFFCVFIFIICYFVSLLFWLFHFIIIINLVWARFSLSFFCFKMEGKEKQFHKKHNVNETKETILQIVFFCLFILISSLLVLCHTSIFKKIKKILLVFIASFQNSF